MSRPLPAWPRRHVFRSIVLVSLALIACSSSPPPAANLGDPPDPGSSCTPIVATGATTTPAGAATCTAPGEATAGAKDTHCAAPDGGVMVQATSAAACCVEGDAGGPGGPCPYGATMYGHEGDDDDCKYHVAWASSPVCEGSAGVQFTVTATYLGSGKPVTGANVRPEVFTTSPANAGCDDVSSHESPSTYSVFAESSPGTYDGRVIFDAAGAWTVRFHLFENCYDVRDDSPHGHAAFHVTVP